MDDIRHLFLYRFPQRTYAVGGAYLRTLPQSICQQRDMLADERIGFRIEVQDFHGLSSVKCGSLFCEEHGGGRSSEKILPQDTKSDAEKVEGRNLLFEKS